MLETRVGYNKLGDCLEDPDHPLSLVKLTKHVKLPISAAVVIKIMRFNNRESCLLKEKLWHSLWDMALDGRKHGTWQMQATLF